MHVSHLDDAHAFVTLDVSTIRELAGRVSLDEPLSLLCCCAPAYRDDDTVLTGG